MRIALAQLNPVVGDFEGNAKRILEAVRRAEEQAVELVLTPELSLWGYPPRDQLLEPSRLQQQDTVLQWLVNQLNSSVTLLVGAALPASDARSPRLHNGVVLVNRLGWRPIAQKQLLPSYDVFDERRYFRPGDGPCLLSLPNGKRLGLTICEDLWVDDGLQRERLDGPDPIDQLIPEQPDLVINLAASPFDASKPALRQQLAAAAAQRLNCPLIYLNQVGGNDELVFDGASFVVGADGAVQLELPVCEEHLAVWDSGHPTPIQIQPMPPLERLFRALVLGVRDYARKCGFNKALLGLSGGIDSALVAVIASAALGNEAVSALLMPSPGVQQDRSTMPLRWRNGLGLKTTSPADRLVDGWLRHNPESCAWSGPKRGDR
jgi:NAD+ synthase/NAD+ synthase (glutamine-hydrolysing)